MAYPPETGNYHFEMEMVVAIGKAGFRVKKMLSGPLGGDAQIAARVAEGKTKMVLFFKDPLANHPHEADVNMLIRVCDVHNVPLATNEASAQIFMNSIRG